MNPYNLPKVDRHTVANPKHGDIINDISLGPMRFNGDDGTWEKIAYSDQHGIMVSTGFTDANGVWTWKPLNDTVNKTVGWVKKNGHLVMIGGLLVILYLINKK